MVAIEGVVMKLKREIFIVPFLGLIMTMAIGCGGGSSGNNNPPAVTYAMNGNTCTSNTGQVVANSYCYTNATSGYYMNGTTCMGPSGPVPYSYCNGVAGVQPVYAPQGPGYYPTYYYPPYYYNQGVGFYFSYSH